MFQEVRPLLRLAAPLALVHAGTQVMSVVDTAVVGRLGAAELGAVGLANGLYMFVSILGLGVMLALDPLISQAFGAGDPLRARRLLWQGAWLALGVSAVLAIPAAASSLLLVPAGIEPRTAELATVYLHLRLVGLVPQLMFVAQRSYLQALGSVRPMLIVMVVGNVANLALDLLLVFGGASLPPLAGPLRLVPALGVAGSAWATVLVIFLQSALVAWAIRRSSLPGHGAGARRPSWPELTGALRVGTPIGLQLGAEVGIFALVGLLAGSLGEGPLAAHQIALTAASLSFTVALGVGAAGAVRVGRQIGAGDGPGTRRAGLTALAAGGLFMALSATVFWVAPRAIARLLTDDPLVVEGAVPLLAVAAVFQISDGLQAVGAGILRGAADTRFAFLANVAGHYGLGLPVALVLGFLRDGGVIGLWWGLCVGLTAVAAALSLRFLRISRRTIAPLRARAAGQAPQGS